MSNVYGMYAAANVQHNIMDNVLLFSMPNIVSSQCVYDVDNVLVMKHFVSFNFKLYVLYVLLV